ncbi:MAG: hypothetical protein QNJ57_01375 [Flavobacteriaceae bacterium]|nr:hypothetical protein [Flavobacteriaceae bacterium]
MIRNPFIAWTEINGIECLQFTFAGIFREADARDAIAEWKTLFKEKPKTKITIVWHCLAMKNYEAKARVLWQETMQELRDQIGLIWLVTDSVIVQAGAEIMSFFVFYDLKVVASIEELHEKIQKQLT